MGTYGGLLTRKAASIDGVAREIVKAHQVGVNKGRSLSNSRMT